MMECCVGRWKSVVLLLLLGLFSLVVKCSDSNSIYGQQHRYSNNPLDFGWNQKDNRKPAFRNCPGYAPVVKEEQEKGTFVIQVEADDPDEGNNITYDLVTSASERAKFQVNSKTGQIYTDHVFDRDEPSLEKSVYVTVKATDDGVPPLEDVCTFKVTIEDINDNPPYFIKAKYDERMAEDTKVDQVVMRISASDLDDGDNSIIEYEILPTRDYQHFRIEKTAGLIYLAKSIDKLQNGYYTINVRAYNVHGREHQATTEVKIRVISSNKKPPSFINPIDEPIYLKENFIDYSTPIAVLSAVSNVDSKPEVIFELITGRTEETNKKKTFVFNQTGNQVQILLGKSLDYESITSYTLTMTVRNTWDLVAEHILRVKILDVNDNIPYFTEVTVGYISENEPAGTPVMQVRAFDMDGTEANNIVTFELADNKEFFSIDPYTGNITALTTFDREERDFYNVKVIARDNSPSALLGTEEHNAGTQVFRIEIVDKNDHKPKFSSDVYHATIKEDANINFIVVEVQAEDIDAASQILYSIVNGNIGDAFKIEPKTGWITVNNHLDYETITDYTLQIRAFDGIYDDNATVIIKVENVNDNPPRFKQENYTTTIQEETVIQDCILRIEAVDPDIKDPTAPQHIKYFVVKDDQKGLLTIDDEGCLRLIQPLDRDAPNGHKHWQVIIAAIDEDGNGEKRLTDVSITLTDINDNAPEITNNQPVIWGENRNPGQIVQLLANDYDEQQNGPPFTYEIAANASEDIKEKFSIQRDYLYANVMFDREEQKEYFIPILISDSGEPRQSKVNTLHLIIGDENDNPMKEGRSRIFVYNYNGEAPSTKIGRVFVDDADDWDLNDKKFNWKDDNNPHEHFLLEQGTGEITMLERTPAGQYLLRFNVFEESAQIRAHYVDAEVTVTVKEIPEEAVDKSGSIRFYNLTEEQFIGISRDSNLDTTLSLKDQLQKLLAKLYNTSIENVDVFTVLAYNTSEKPQTLDVRFSAHGSPYYAPEKLNGILSTNNHQQEIEHALGLEIQMINIDECLIEMKKCETSCTNVLYKSHVPHMIYSNTTSFVGVNAYVKAECECKATLPQTNCLNNGTYDALKGQCECEDGYNGPYCERVSVGFHGSGYAMYPPISPCDNTRISLELAPRIDYGLVMYIGPMSYNHLLPIQDFLSLELVEGFPVLTVDYGSGATRIEHKHVKLENGKTYTIDIILQKSSIEMMVDNCKLSKCMSLGAPYGPNEFLNVNSPVQLGGTPINLDKLGHQFNWTFIPSTQGYSGCISNLSISGHIYNIGEPHFYKNIDPGCQNAVVAAVQFGIDRNFLIAIIVCICILLILLLAVVVQKRQQNGWNEKDTDDIRETIINYEDEGGGERDTDYDLNVLRPPIYEEKPSHGLMMPPLHNNNIQDIVGFLGDKKDSCDKDSLAYPVDDVRHYAYEGDGNSDGSLSSLASCTDEGDLNFDYLSNFGPRFRKLADMYGEEPSDDDSNVDDEPGWRI